jgi:hypothetical protein
MELVKFDLQQMEQPEICGAAYQQGTLFGYELREYLLQKWNRQCAYCGKTAIPLQNAGTHVGRMAAKASGGFTIAIAKGNVTDIGKKYCRHLQRADGYGYTKKEETAFPPVP